MDEQYNMRSPAEVIVFSIITCGIYALVWIYKFSGELKRYLGKDDINPGTDLLLCILCFPYAIYWAYKAGKLIMEARKKAGLPEEDNSILFLVLAIIGLFIIDMAIMQSNANEVWKKIS
jgi:hypothetical protein